MSEELIEMRKVTRSLSRKYPDLQENLEWISTTSERALEGSAKCDYKEVLLRIGFIGENTGPVEERFREIGIKADGDWDSLQVAVYNVEQKIIKNLREICKCLPPTWER